MLELLLQIGHFLYLSKGPFGLWHSHSFDLWDHAQAARHDVSMIRGALAHAAT
jgi:hypothetical protein